MKMEFSAGGIVYKKNSGDAKFALILNSYGEWTYPKGKIEKKEKPEAAALREVSEEIGLSDLKVVTLLKKIDYWYRVDVLVHKFVYFYLMEAPADAELVPQEAEISEAKWCSFEDAQKILGYPKEDLPLLQQAQEVILGKR